MQFRAIVPAVAIAIASFACLATDASESDPSVTSPSVTTPSTTTAIDTPEIALVDALADGESFALGATPLDIVEGRADALHVHSRLAWVEGLSSGDTELIIDYSDDQLLATPLLELCVRGDAPTGTVELTACPGAVSPPPVS